MLSSFSSSFRRIGCRILPGRELLSNELDPAVAAPVSPSPTSALLSHDKVRRRGRLKSTSPPPDVSVKEDKNE